MLCPAGITQRFTVPAAAVFRKSIANPAFIPVAVNSLNRPCRESANERLESSVNVVELRAVIWAIASDEVGCATMNAGF